MTNNPHKGNGNGEGKSVVVAQSSYEVCRRSDQSWCIPVHSLPRQEVEEDYNPTLTYIVTGRLNQSLGSSISSLQIRDYLGRVFSEYVTETAINWGHLFSTLSNEPDVETKSRFAGLVNQWKEGRGVTSSLTAMIVHPAYQQIIGMGEKVVPLLLTELKSEPDHWFWALKAITGQDPVPEESRGRLAEMAKAWLEWGRSQGYRF